MLAIVLPWCIAIATVSHGDFFAQAVGRNLLGKVAQGQQAHGAPPGYYLALFLLTFWPGALFAVLAVPFVWINRRSQAVRFCLCWVAATWVVFELIVTKLPHYVLPTYPAIACLAAAGALSARDWYDSRWRGWVLWPAATLWLVLGLVLACGPPAVTWRVEGYVSPIGVLTALAAVTLMAATILLLRRARVFGAVACAAAGAFIVFASVYSQQLPRLQTIWLSPRIAAAVEHANTCPHKMLATVPYNEPSLAFLVGTDIKFVDVRGAARHLLEDPLCALALVGAAESDEFMSLATAGGVRPREVSRIRGINYSYGKPIELILYTVAPAS
jgi:4-amino-4-deoxy-L-arabinose transferase-like glycosyltransferase